MNEDLKNQQFEQRDLALEELGRLRGMFGAVQYLMSGCDRPREKHFEDFETWIRDIRDKLDHLRNFGAFSIR